MGTRGLWVWLSATAGVVVAGTLVWLVLSQRASSARFEALAAMRARLQQDAARIADCPCMDVRGIVIQASADAAAVGPHFGTELDELQAAAQRRLADCVPQSLDALVTELAAAKSRGGAALASALERVKGDRAALLDGGSLHQSDRLSDSITAVDKAIADTEKLIAGWVAKQQELKAKLEAEDRAAQEAAAQDLEIRKAIEQMEAQSRRDPKKGLLQYAVLIETKQARLDYDADLGRFTVMDAQYKQTESVISPFEGHIVCEYRHINLGTYEVVIILAPRKEGGWEPLRITTRWTGKDGLERPDNDIALEKAQALFQQIVDAQPSM